MNLSMNIHPHQKWVGVDASLHGEWQGSCIHLHFEDSQNKHIGFSLHYGAQENASEFVAMLKEAVNKL